MKKNGNIHKDFELYQIFNHNSLCQNVPVFPLDILRTKRINTFWSKGINKFWSRGIGTVLVPKNHTSKIRSYSHTTQTTNYLVWVLD